MRLSRTYRAVLVFLFVGFLGATGPALDGRSIRFSPTQPAFAGLARLSTRRRSRSTPRRHARRPGVFNFFVVNGPMPGPFQVPFTLRRHRHRTVGLPDLGPEQRIRPARRGPARLDRAPTARIHESRRLGPHDPQLRRDRSRGSAVCRMPDDARRMVEWIYWPGATDGRAVPALRWSRSTATNRARAASRCWRSRAVQPDRSRSTETRRLLPNGHHHA